MGGQESTPVEADGKINGKPVTFFYKKNDEIGEKELLWQEHEHASSFKGSISAKDLIAVLPAHAQVSDDYSVLYTESNIASQDDAKASLIIFKSLVATHPPEAFVHAFQPPGNACWQLRQDDGSIPNLHIVVSIGSGMGQADSVWSLLLKPLLQHVCPNSDKFALHHTSSERTITNLTRDVFLPHANDGVTQAIILLSGDGGIVDVVNGLLSGTHSRRYKKPNIALLPLGTGNAMAHSSGVTGDNTLGLKTLLQGTAKDIPLFQASFSPGARFLINEAREERPLQMVDGAATIYGAVVCSWGFHAGLVADSDTQEYRKFGRERFKMAAQEALFPKDGSPPHAYKGKVTFLRSSTQSKEDWQTLDRATHVYILATPVSQLEKGFTVSPASKPLDGKLRFVHFGDVGAQGTMEIMGKAYDGGKHVDDKRAGYEEIEGLRIEFDEEDARWRRVCVDGKIVRVEKGGWVEIRSGIKGVADLIVM